VDNSTHSVGEISSRCQLCREDVNERINSLDRRLLALEITVRGEDGRNGMKAQLNCATSLIALTTSRNAPFA